MGIARVHMNRWWENRDAESLAWLLAHRAQRSPTRRLSNALGDYGEYLVWRALGGTRTAQPSGEGDIVMGGPRRIVEVKTTRHPYLGWPLGYAPTRLDFALVRINIADWSVAEAWFVPLPVAQRHVRGQRHVLSPGGAWQRERRTRRLDLNRF